MYSRGSVVHMCPSIAGWETWPWDGETKGQSVKSNYTDKGCGFFSLTKVCSIKPFLTARAGYTTESSYEAKNLKEISGGRVEN